MGIITFPNVLIAISEPWQVILVVACMVLFFVGAIGLAIYQYVATKRSHGTAIFDYDEYAKSKDERSEDKTR